MFMQVCIMTALEVGNPVAVIYLFIFHSKKTSGDSSSLVESRPTALGGS